MIGPPVLSERGEAVTRERGVGLISSLRCYRANMTMGMDMSPLFGEVVACMNIQVLEIKKMVSCGVCLVPARCSLVLTGTLPHLRCISI